MWDGKIVGVFYPLTKHQDLISCLYYHVACACFVVETMLVCQVMFEVGDDLSCRVQM